MAPREVWRNQEYKTQKEYKSFLKSVDRSTCEGVFFIFKLVCVGGVGMVSLGLFKA